MSTLGISREVRDGDQPTSVAVKILVAAGLISASAQRGQRSKFWAPTDKGRKYLKNRAELVEAIRSRLNATREFTTEESMVLRLVDDGKTSLDGLNADIPHSRTRIGRAVKQLVERGFATISEDEIALTSAALRELAPEGAAHRIDIVKLLEAVSGPKMGRPKGKVRVQSAL